MSFTYVVLMIATEEFVAAGDFLTYKFPVWTWWVAHIFPRIICDQTTLLQGEG